MSRRADRDEVAAWMRLHPGAKYTDLMREFGLPRSTAARWAEQIPREKPPELKVAVRPPRERGSPADRLPEDDRERAVTTVRSTYRILERAVRRLEAQLDEPGTEVPRIDRDTAQAMLNLQRMAAGLIDAHPGLLELVKGDAAGEDSLTEDDLNGILAGIAHAG